MRKKAFCGMLIYCNAWLRGVDRLIDSNLEELEIAGWWRIEMCQRELCPDDFPCVFTVNLAVWFDIPSLSTSYLILLVQPYHWLDLFREVCSNFCGEKRVHDCSSRILGRVLDNWYLMMPPEASEDYLAFCYLAEMWRHVMEPFCLQWILGWKATFNGSLGVFLKMHFF